jgi:hypothetical protein
MNERKEEKTKMLIKYQNVHMYVLLTHTRTLAYYMTDPFSRQGEWPHDKQNCNCLDYNQNQVMSLGGAQDGRTASCEVTQTHRLLTHRMRQAAAGCSLTNNGNSLLVYIT